MSEEQSLTPRVDHIPCQQPHQGSELHAAATSALTASGLGLKENREGKEGSEEDVMRSVQFCSVELFETISSCNIRGSDSRHITALQTRSKPRPREQYLGHWLDRQNSARNN